MFMRRGTGKEPPFSVVLENGRIGMRARNQVVHQSPLIGEGNGAIKTDGICSESFRSHIEIISPAEYVWVREMKRFLQDDSFVMPCQTVAAGSVANVAFVGLVI